MLFKAAVLAGGVAGAAGLSQFPEYAQQYQQRLAGAVDALSVVVADFDRSATEAGLTRSEALDQMTGTPFLENRQADMQRTFDRYAILNGLLVEMRNRGPFETLTLAPRLTDPDIARAAMHDFKPALPLTTTGAGFAGIGFLAGGLVVWALWSIVGWPVRGVARRRAARRDARAARVIRQEPSLTAQSHV
ncbi:MAG: DUF2937 family protein [Pseudomonadota bacterium]